jgi:uncharacterized Zn finger protein
VIVDEGRPVVVTSERERIGSGPWARLFASGVVGAEGTTEAERGRAFARHGDVHTVDVEQGELAAVVDGEQPRIAALPVSPRIWATVVRSHGKGRLQDGIEGREQSLHLEHLMRFDWEEPLVPDRDALSRTCTCGRAPGCEHVAALAYVFADLIDRDPSLLLRWRGCTEVQVDEEPEPPSLRVAADAWDAGELPVPRPLRPLPPGAVLKSLGQSGVRVAGVDLADVLQRAYAAFASDS